MIRTLIVDDELHCISTLEGLFKEKEGYLICGMAQSVDEAISLTKQYQPQLVLLDIILGEQTGFDYLNAFLPNLEFDIIFTTGHNEYAVRAFHYSALHYILKPIDEEDLSEALVRLEEKMNSQERLEKLLSLEYNYKTNELYRYIHLSSANMVEKVYSKDIVYLAADNNYTIFHLANGRKKTVSKTLKFYSDLLKDSHFYKISKSFLVNVEQIATYRKNTRELVLKNNVLLSVAARRHSDFLKSVLTNKNLKNN